MKSTLKQLVMTVLALVGVSAMAGTNTWTPSGYVAMSVASKAISPSTSSMYYNKPYVMVDAWLDLPAGFAIEVDEYKGLGDLDFDNDGVSEFDVLAYKTFKLPADAYLKFRVAFYDCGFVSHVNGDDILAYDAYLGRTFESKYVEQMFGGIPVSLTPEIRVEYWHFARKFDEGMFVIMPSVSAECKVNSHLTAYQKLALQWGNKLAPYGQLLSGQVDVGVKTDITKNLSWNVIDIFGVLPLTEVKVGDPRSENGAVAFATTLTYGF